MSTQQADMIIRQAGVQARRIARLEQLLEDERASHAATSQMYAELIVAAWDLCKVVPPSQEALLLLYQCQPHAGSVDMHACQCCVCERLRVFLAALPAE